MADRKASSSRPEKPKESSGNAVTRFIRRLSPTKRYRGDETVGASFSSTTQENASSSRKKDSSTKKDAYHGKEKLSEKLSKSFLNLPEASLSSGSNHSSPKSPWLTPTSSYQSLNQDDRAKELKLLSQLHSNFDEATNILGNYISLRDQKK
ncbi:hypothetical protein GFV_13g0060 [Bracoviriform facetosae]|uniref:Uncharacterized protein n=1 Tax=Bracoviriform facetosae TaxID=2083300 RepID=B8PQ66_9VIRU|nr:hypothetical protein GFV_13g0060 [Bracoviriform facetosae]ACE75492.1 hypothetical protein GFV_13g0060 [Bracoviriform facetosae]